jgi:membrane-associated phospholipid phosphatase
VADALSRPIRIGRQLAAPALLALYVVAVGTSVGRRLDEGLFDLLTSERVEPLAKAITHVVNPLTCALAAIPLLVAAYRRSPAAVWVVAAFLVACNVSAWLLETGLGRLDPLGGEQRRALGAEYFPSGHVTAATSLALAALLLAPAERRTTAAIACTGFAAVFGLAVVVSGSHTPGDVLGAWLLTGGLAAVAAPRVVRCSRERAVG